MNSFEKDYLIVLELYNEIDATIDRVHKDFGRINHFMLLCVFSNLLTTIATECGVERKEFIRSMALLFDAKKEELEGISAKEVLH